MQVVSSRADRQLDKMVLPWAMSRTGPEDIGLVHAAMRRRACVVIAVFWGG